MKEIKFVMMFLIVSMIVSCDNQTQPLEPAKDNPKKKLPKENLNKATTEDPIKKDGEIEKEVANVSDVVVKVNANADALEKKEKDEELSFEKTGVSDVQRAKDQKWKDEKAQFVIDVLKNPDAWKNMSESEIKVWATKVFGTNVRKLSYPALEHLAKTSDLNTATEAYTKLGLGAVWDDRELGEDTPRANKYFEEAEKLFGINKPEDRPNIGELGALETFRLYELWETRANIAGAKKDHREIVYWNKVLLEYEMNTNPESPNVLYRHGNYANALMNAGEKELALKHMEIAGGSEKSQSKFKNILKDWKNENYTCWSTAM